MSDNVVRVEFTDTSKSSPKSLIESIMSVMRDTISDYDEHKDHIEWDSWTTWTAYIEELIAIEEKTARLVDGLMMDIDTDESANPEQCKILVRDAIEKRRKARRMFCEIHDLCLEYWTGE